MRKITPVYDFNIPTFQIVLLLVHAIELLHQTQRYTILDRQTSLQDRQTWDDKKVIFLKTFTGFY